MMKVLLIAIFSLLCQVAFGQEGRWTAGDSPFARVESRRMGEGRIVIRQSPAVEQMMGHYVRNNRNMPGVEGYRIQLYSGTGAQARQEAQEVRTKLLSQFPDERVLVEYNAPFWRVRVGSFRHKHEALPLLKNVRGIFPNSYVVREPAIRLDDFNRN
ncbi:SPOR domain-containing protein [Natronoflexus pectinivorans]|uniref:Sporulation related protein n=1 Tax=Natronoflexus pectinivorans TaxID=682526 RepID=A0A4R2GAJ3_9BACT|nr:SPOR domain-containing protein [Natronoflexus pectinivorans]TCO04967.1 sporulation related protein [Natronoflexus pectinivorans]